MSDEDRGPDPLVDAIATEDITVAGDPDEALAVIEERIAELEDALEVIDEDDPQYRAVRFELGMLKKSRETLVEHYDVVDEGDVDDE